MHCLPFCLLLFVCGLCDGCLLLVVEFWLSCVVFVCCLKLFVVCCVLFVVCCWLVGACWLVG